MSRDCRHASSVVLQSASILVMLAGFSFDCSCTAAGTVPIVQSPQQENASGETADQRMIQALRLTPRAFRTAAARIQPTLVTIESFGGSSTASGRIGGIRQQGEGNTTGVMISKDGYVITSSFNFIEQPTTITVLTSDGKRWIAELKGRDDTRRICLLKIAPDAQQPLPDFEVPEFLAPEQVRVGQWAVSVGVGFGDTNPAISMGIISATGRIGGKAIQTDANISPANYGGPLLDIEGKVIGICVPMSANSQSLASGVEWYDSGIGFCIPIAGNEALIERMKKGQHIKRAFLGVQTQDAAGRNGVQVTQVLPGTAADKAKLKKDDLIVGINDRVVKNVADFRTILATLYAGDEIELVLNRDDKGKTIKIELGEPTRQESQDTPSLFPGRRRADPSPERR